MVEFEFGPQTIGKFGWVAIDAVDEGFAGIEEVAHRIVAMVACHLFSHPLPETFDRVQVGIETNHAHTFRGLCARLYTKLTAHTLCIYINRLLGVQDYLQIKKLAFPI